MLDELYIIFSIFVTGSLLFVFGFCFLFLSVPCNPSLRNYRTARRMMAYSYLFFGIINIVEYFTRSDSDNIRLTQAVTMVIAASQAVLFTYALITLVNTQFVVRRRLVRDLLPVSLFIAAVFIVCFVCSAACFDAFFYLFILFYGFLLVRFTRLFLLNYRRYRMQMDNYFSERESRRLRWVIFSFFAALSVGVLALVSTVFMSLLGALLFSALCAAFYTYFGIRFINYVFIFQYIETAITGDEKTERNERLSFADIKKKLEEWIAGKLFTEKGITVEQLSRRLNTNRTYLSGYINSCENKTFRNWINELRIKEAQRLLLQYPDKPAGEIAVMTGFSDGSHFGRLFAKQTGISPQAWRKQSKNTTIPSK